MGGLKAKQIACWKPSQICNTSNKPINNRVKGQPLLLKMELYHCGSVLPDVSNENNAGLHLQMTIFLTCCHGNNYPELIKTVFECLIVLFTHEFPAVTRHQ